MRYVLPAHLSFCLAGGRAVFLDLAHDRYFRLGAAPDALFQTLLSSGHASEQDTETLVRLGVVRPASAGEGLSPAVAASASRSAPETEPSGWPTGVLITLQVVHAVVKARLSLKLFPIAHVLDRLRKRRAALTEPGIPRFKAPSDDIMAVAMQFNQARRVVPIDTVCLLDSLALVDFLAGRGLFAHLIMGVKLNPFVAHCWVQHRDVILNDAFDRASAYTPILVV